MCGPSGGPGKLDGEAAGAARGRGVSMRTADPSKAPRIIDSAGQLFAERPYHEEVRMDDIAARGRRLEKGTLYLHFVRQGGLLVLPP